MLTNNVLLFFLISPLHSFIIDLDDGSLEDQIGQEEFEEIQSFSDDALNTSSKTTERTDACLRRYPSSLMMLDLDGTR